MVFPSHSSMEESYPFLKRYFARKQLTPRSNCYENDSEDRCFKSHSSFSWVKLGSGKWPGYPADTALSTTELPVTLAFFREAMRLV